MMQDLGDKLDASADAALREGRQPEQAVHEVLTEAAVLAYQGKQTPRRPKMAEKLAKEINSVLPQHERPATFPHYRKAWNLGATEAGQPAKPPDSFFSKKPWHAVHGISPDMADLANILELPRPSRIQNLTYYDIVEGNSTVIADQAGSGKTLSYLLPLLKRYIFDDEGSEQPSAKAPLARYGRSPPEPKPEKPKLKLLILAPTSDLVEQIVNVARLISARSGKRFRVHACTGGHRLYTQQKQLQAGTDILVATPGRLKFLMFEDDWKALDLRHVKAVVLDEVDVLLQDESNITMEELRMKLTGKMQWIFVTATLAELARKQLQDFELLPSVSGAPAEPGKAPKKGLVWHTGPGLHRVSPMCEHVLVDCTPERLNEMKSDKKHASVMREKVLALAWHLKHGVLRKVEDNRVVIFCNTIDNCRVVENELRKLDPRDRRTGNKAWKVLVLHSSRNKDDYRNIVAEFHGERVESRDFFKKKILVCTDRMSRGIDFSRQPVNWVVLLDWPRDATEYLRRVGRTARGGGRGSVLAFASGFKELKYSKTIIAAAVRSIPLQGGVIASAEFQEKQFVLERFDPQHPDWRSPEASAARPRGAGDEQQQQDEEAPEEAEEASAAPKSWQRPVRDPAQVDEEAFAAAEDAWTPWTDAKWDGMKGVPWEEGDGDFVDDDYYDDLDDDDDLFGDSLGVGLND